MKKFRITIACDSIVSMVLLDFFERIDSQSGIESDFPLF
jgi:hypothetical protein